MQCTKERIDEMKPVRRHQVVCRQSSRTNGAVVLPSVAAAVVVGVLLLLLLFVSLLLLLFELSKWRQYLIGSKLCCSQGFVSNAPSSRNICDPLPVVERFARQKPSFSASIGYDEALLVFLRSNSLLRHVCER
jgi:hypothetical protein